MASVITLLSFWKLYIPPISFNIYFWHIFLVTYLNSRQATGFPGVSRSRTPPSRHNRTYHWLLELERSESTGRYISRIRTKSGISQIRTRWAKPNAEARAKARPNSPWLLGNLLHDNPDREALFGFEASGNRSVGCLFHLIWGGDEATVP